MKQLNHANSKQKTDGNYSSLWKEVSRDLIAHYGEDLYKSWLSKIDFVEVQGESTVILTAPSNFVRDWIKANYHDVITHLCIHHYARLKQVDIITQERVVVPKTALESAELELVEQGFSLDTNKYSLAYLDPRFTFDNFVVGSPNELAYAAALSVAESDSAVVKSNPLFLYGGVGLGKTHLMHVIAWHCHIKSPNRKVLYMSAEKFIYRFIKALRNKDVMSFKDEFRSVDILMIDDIQFISRQREYSRRVFPYI